MKYLFLDLDGTITESKKELKEDMLQQLGRLSKKYKIIIVSGGELSRVLIQAPVKYATFMSQNGNEVYENEKILWTNILHNKEDIMQHITAVASEMKVIIGEDMIDDRGSQISFSFIGHHGPTEIKNNFDPDRKKRALLLDKFPFKGAVIGGTTCIDYIPYTKGENISRYLFSNNIRSQDCLYIGDAFMNYGNDATVIGVIPIHQVENPLQALNFIKEL